MLGFSLGVVLYTMG